MNSITETFEKNKYVVLSGALSPFVCKQLTEELFVLHKQGLMRKDEQCPKSDAIYDADIFKELHKKFAGPLSNYAGKTLVPSYTYARIYRNGEVLEKHIDRPSCEYSATITLGHDSDTVWPIFFADVSNQNPSGNSVDLEIGELAFYKGQEIEHWRPKFKGQWQTQVFFHYVDVEGENKDHAFDNLQRTTTNNTEKVTWPKVSNKQQSIKPINNATGVSISPTDPNRISLQSITNDVVWIPNLDTDMPGYTCFNSNFKPELIFTKQECDKIIEWSKTKYSSEGIIGAGLGSSKKLDKSIRNVDITIIPNKQDTYWIFEKLSRAVMVANCEYFDFDIVGITHGLQLLKYEANDIPGHYDWHSDAGTGETCNRKISVSVQLSDPNLYEGGELEVDNYGTKTLATREQGSIHLFPSFMVHRVKPVTQGTRYALVIWVNGARRFR